MNKFYKKSLSIGLLIILLFPLMYSLFTLNSYCSSNPKKKDEKHLKIKLNSGEVDITIESEFPSLIYIEGHLKIEIISNASGKIRCVFTDSRGGDYFQNIREIREIEGNSQRKTFKFISRPHFITTPGKYRLTLVVFYIREGENTDKGDQVYSEDYDTILGIGHFLIISILIVFGTAIIVLLSRKEKIEDVKPSTGSVGAAYVEAMAGLPPEKIRCPKCSKVVEKGVTFCPECGERIIIFGIS